MQIRHWAVRRVPLNEEAVAVAGNNGDSLNNGANEGTSGGKGKDS